MVGLAGTLSLAACGSADSPSGYLNAAGASFPAAIYWRWFQELSSKGVSVNYQSVGSGAGVHQFQAETVDFAASDKPMEEEEIAEVSRGVLQIPMTAGAIAVAYNYGGCELSLSQEQLADIFLGKITNFGDLGCEDKPISIVHRSDGSGTTYNFTKHPSAISPEWDGGPGAGKSISWPVGFGAKGNEGVSAQLKQIDGGIGYVEVAYVKDGLQAAALENASGESVKPTNEAKSESLASIDLGPDLIGGNPNPDTSYPIVAFTWVLVYEPGNVHKAPLLILPFDFMLSGEAQAQAPELGYVTLPPEVVEQAKEQVARISE